MGSTIETNYQFQSNGIDVSYINTLIDNTVHLITSVRDPTNIRRRIIYFTNTVDGKQYSDHMTNSEHYIISINDKKYLFLFGGKKYGSGDLMKIARCYEITDNPNCVYVGNDTGDYVPYGVGFGLCPISDKEILFINAAHYNNINSYHVLFTIGIDPNESLGDFYPFSHYKGTDNLMKPIQNGTQIKYTIYNNYIQFLFYKDMNGDTVITYSLNGFTYHEFSRGGSLDLNSNYFALNSEIILYINKDTNVCGFIDLTSGTVSGFLYTLTYFKMPKIPLIFTYDVYGKPVAIGCFYANNPILLPELNIINGKRNEENNYDYPMSSFKINLLSKKYQSKIYIYQDQRMIFIGGPDE